MGIKKFPRLPGGEARPFVATTIDGDKHDAAGTVGQERIHLRRLGHVVQHHQALSQLVGQEERRIGLQNAQEGLQTGVGFTFSFKRNAGESS